MTHLVGRIVREVCVARTFLSAQKNRVKQACPEAKVIRPTHSSASHNLRLSALNAAEGFQGFDDLRRPELDLLVP
jgi:hypothetical protein